MEGKWPYVMERKDRVGDKYLVFHSLSHALLASHESYEQDDGHEVINARKGGEESWVGLQRRKAGK